MDILNYSGKYCFQLATGEYKLELQCLLYGFFTTQQQKSDKNKEKLQKQKTKIRNLKCTIEKEVELRREKVNKKEESKKNEEVDKHKMKILGGITASRKDEIDFLLHKVTLNTTHRVSYIKYFNNLLKKGEEEEELVQRASFISTLFDPILVTTSSGSRTSMRNNSMTNMEELMKVFDSLMEDLFNIPLAPVYSDSVEKQSYQRECYILDCRFKAASLDALNDPEPEPRAPEPKETENKRLQFKVQSKKGLNISMDSYNNIVTSLQSWDSIFYSSALNFILHSSFQQRLLRLFSFTFRASFPHSNMDFILILFVDFLKMIPFCNK